MVLLRKGTGTAGAHGVAVGSQDMTPGGHFVRSQELRVGGVAGGDGDHFYGKAPG